MVRWPSFWQERPIGGHARVDGRGIEQRNAGVLLRDQKRDFRTAKHDPFGALVDELGHDSPIFIARCLNDPSKTQLFVDDAVNDVTVVLAGYQHLKTVPFAKPVLVERLFHGEPRTEQTDRRQPGVLDGPGSGVRYVE